MRNASRTNDAVPKWLWAALGVGILMLAGAVWWAGSVGSSSRAAVAPQAPEPVGAGPVVVRDGPAVAQPLGATQNPWAGGGYSGPRVMVAPVQTLPAPRPIKIPVADPMPKRAHATRAVSPLADMFPFGPISPGAVKKARANPSEGEQFPSFTYGGVSWTFSGAFVDAGQFSLTATGLELDGRSVLTLADALGPTSVLLVQSRLDPGKFAIYQ